MDQATVGVAGQLWSTAGDLLGGATRSPARAGGRRPRGRRVDAHGGGAGGHIGMDVRLGARAHPGAAWRSGHGRPHRGHAGLSRGVVIRSGDALGRRRVRQRHSGSRGRDARWGRYDLVDSAPEAAPMVWTPTNEVPPEVDGALGRWWSGRRKRCSRGAPTGCTPISSVGPTSPFESMATDSSSPSRVASLGSTFELSVMPGEPLSSWSGRPTRSRVHRGESAYALDRFADVSCGRDAMELELDGPEAATHSRRHGRRDGSGLEELVARLIDLVQP